MRSLLLACLAALVLLTVRADDFRHPPREHYPETWFHFLGGNISREGILADVDAIASAGIRGIHFFDGLSRCGAFPGVTNLVRSLSPEWMDAVGLLATACKDRGLGFVVQNCPGWSMSGGPWITADNTMRELVMGRTLVAAGECVRANCADKATDQSWRDYRDIAVLAFPSVAGEWDRPLVPDAVVTNADGFTLRFREPVTARTLELPPVRKMELLWVYEPALSFALSADGQEVVRGEYPPASFHEELPLSVALGERTAREWRVTYRGRHEFRPAPFALLPMAKMQNWEAMAAWTLRGVMPRPMVSSARGGAVATTAVLDLTERLRADGSLDWTPPEGRWTILRFGHVNMGRKNHPAVREATGWECDKLDPRGVEANFRGYVEMLMQGPLADGKLQGVLLDSWECDTQTWTWRLPEEFRARRGSAVRKILPALFGYVLDDEQETERHLRDWRGFLGELVEENYYRRMSELTRAKGLHLQYETAFGDIIAGDLLRYWKYADTPMCEFWQPHDEAHGGVESCNYKPVRPCVSAAHVYGKKRVAAEAFTSFQLTFDEDFNLLKRIGDFNFAKGVTHFVFQTYSHNPLTNAPPPGVSFGRKVGTPFLRGQPWWPFMKGFCTYLARCETQLERGKPVVDVLWYLGDAIGHKPDERCPFPAGLKYDYCNQDVLLHRLSVRDGRLMLPDGLSYAALWVPPGMFLAPESVVALKALSRQGAKVFREVPVEALRTLPVQVSGDGGRLNWYHRRDRDEDIYFVAVETNDFTGPVVFHASGGNRRLDLNLKAGESRFVFCGKDGAKVMDPVLGEEELAQADRVWRTWPVEAGSTGAELKFACAGVKSPVVLDLGEVHAWARVSVNGVRLRDLWCAPYRIDLSPFLRSGENVVSVEVVSTCYNQLVRDAAKPPEERVTSTVCGPAATDPLHPAGLYGPVTLRTF